MNGVHKVAYSMVAGTFFWIGTVHNEASKPIERFKRVTPPPALTPALQPICENLTEIRIACTASKKSGLIQQITRNSKGSM